MPPSHQVSIKSGSVNALNAQKPNDIYPTGFPFTLNPTEGCSFACKFCYSPASPVGIFNRNNHFFNEAVIKLDIADSLDNDLHRLSSLPQHLKRVQINEHSDYYLMEVLKRLNELNRDVMLEILEVFQNHWNDGNKWMLHILTKSYLIESHIDKLKEMKEMIQVEMSFSTPYENQRRDFELYTPPIPRRIKTIEKLSNEDIFVRVMAMPFYGGVSELDELKRITFDAGAKAMKNKALNYFNWNEIKNITFDDLIQNKLPKSSNRNDTIISQNHMIKSGEEYLVNDQTETIDIVMPSDKAWDAMSKFTERSSAQTLAKVEMGYDDLNDVDWGYIKSKIVNLQSSIRTNIMSNSNLSAAQKFYSPYFPELLKEPPDKKIYEVNSPFISNDTAKSLEIDNGGIFTCKKSKKTGFISHFYQWIEGIPESEQMKYFQLINSGGFLPDLSVIQDFSKELFDANNSAVLDYFRNKRGLSDNTLKDNYIGYNKKNNRIVFPILNATGKGLTAVKYFDYPYEPSSGKNHMIGYTRLYNYYNLKYSNKKIPKLFYVVDPLDALLLVQEGYDVLCNILDGNKWYPDWNDLIVNSDVYYFAEHINDESISVVNRFKGKASSIKRVSISNNSIAEYFLKGNKSDFEKLLSGAQEITDQVIKNFKIIKEAEDSPPPKKDFNIAQDFVQNKMYYGLMINDELKFISSDRNLLDATDLENEGFELKYDKVDDSNFSSSGYKNFVLQHKSIKPSELFTEIKQYIKKYVFLDSDSIYDVLSLWIMGTYVFRIFKYFPYIHLQAEMGSGKSHLMDVIKPICFNGVTQASQTPAALYREVERNSRTLLLDEVEDLQKTSGLSGAINKVLNSGFQKSGSVARSRGDEVIYFNTYSPKMFAGISDVYSTLTNRIIKIHMKKKLDEEKTEVFRDSAELLNTQATIRDQLYIFGLMYAEQIASYYNDNPELHNYLKTLSNRNYDLWAPLFIIAEIIDQEFGSTENALSISINNYLKREEYYHKISGVESDTIKLLESLKDVLPELRYVKVSEDEQTLMYLSSDLYNAFKGLSEYKKELTSVAKLTRLLGKVEIQNDVVNVEGDSKRCYFVNLASLKEFAKRYGVDFQTADLVRKKSESSKEFVPNRLIITENSKNAPLTNQIISKVKSRNPNVEIVYEKVEKPPYPSTVAITDRYNYLKETLLLGTRGTSFTNCFPSPGNIVEGMTTTTNLQLHCSSNCEFCYLHATAYSDPRWRIIYTNLDKWENEIKKEKLVFDFANSLWSAISFYKQATLPKIPKGFKEIVDNFREEALKPNSIINDLNDVKKHLKSTLTDQFGKLGLTLDYKRIEEIKNDLLMYFKENSKLKLKLNVGEFCDIVRTNHLTGHLEYLMNLVQRDKDFNITIYIKSMDIDDLVKFNGHNRVQITFGFNTDYAISKWEKDTSSLDERFDAFNKIQAAKGFHVRPSIEPIIAYKGYKDDYRELAKRMKKELNLAENNVTKIKFGCLRIGDKLKPVIENNFPGTTLFNETEKMYDPVGDDGKQRYSEPERKEIYRILLEEFAAYRNKLALACEYPSMWDDLNMDYRDHLKDYIYQYPG